MKILVTGGAGYIGSHTCVELLLNNFEVVVVDDLSNSSEESLNRVREITGKKIDFYPVNLLDRAKLNGIFQDHDIDAVIHFAGFKAVGESVDMPLAYYTNNLTGTLTLLDVMRNHKTRHFVFSSSATVYGDPASLPITENFPLSVTNPYGRTKLMIEEILQDLYVSDDSWNIALLRYFNPVGAHESGKIGEDPRGIPNNLVPYIAQVAVGRRPFLNVFGDDYDTVDGTGVRDFIHVSDLARGHIKALEKLFSGPGVVIYNLGTGTGTSVLELVKGFEAACGKEIPFCVVPRRAGDIAACYADAALAEKELGWKAVKSVADMCRDTWRWQQNNPHGYDDTANLP
ncbi:UDP-galactose 4-epimerase [Desulfocicer vacuolatum DSM 3385]|uniref:UDP-glucose 4-epimerase n=1 Tax=Desulfocicer vacuolatum DSM 3385 TaxID=1121400 RepID=A0A1W2BS77_9BACT|nr:UDP-glucose 4-epimerase GalE [Desulfocicer vacuolatum]SMC75830.1 UDP-galactose 4-epimerase [Desulfocicer vacuolatum DSM 3385]